MDQILTHAVLNSVNVQVGMSGSSYNCK